MGIVLTHNAKYKPMSFEDMIKPYVMATEEYRTLEKGIADLDAEAESLRSLAEKDIVRKEDGSVDKEKSKSYAIKYMDYADSLDKQAEQLASRGLKGVNRKSLYDLQAQYKTNVKPIEEADKYIKEIAKEQRLANKEGNLVFDRDFSNGVSIQDVIDNPSLGYNTYNLDDYGKQAVLEGTAIKSGMTPTYLGKDPTNQNMFYSQGMSDEDLNNWLAGTSNEELDATVNRIAGNAPQAVKDRVKSDLAKSLRATVSKEANRGFETPAQINSRIKYDASLTAQMNRNDYTWNKDKNAWELTPLGLQKELLRQDTEYKKLGQTIDKDKDGKYLTNEDGTPKVRPLTKEEKEQEQKRERYQYQNLGNGKIVQIDKITGEYKVIDALNNEDTKILSDNGSIPVPIFIDKAGWLPGWSSPGYEGEDLTGPFNWVDINRQTRDYGADYSLEADSPTIEDFKNNFEKISYLEMSKDADLIKGYNKLINSSKFKNQNIDNYVLFKAKGNKAGLLLLPKSHPYVKELQSNQGYQGNWIKKDK